MITFGGRDKSTKMGNRKGRLWVREIPSRGVVLQGLNVPLGSTSFKDLMILGKRKTETRRTTTCLLLLDYCSHTDGQNSVPFAMHKAL